MAGGFRILSVDGARNADVSTDQSLQVLLFDGNGRALAYQNAGVLAPVTARGLPLIGDDYKIARLIRGSVDGTLKAGNSSPVFYDSIEGATVDTNKWTATTTTMTITQAIGTGTNYNNGASVATTVGAQEVSTKQFPFIGKNGYEFRCRVRHTAHFNGNLIESGFGPAGATATTAAVVNGAFWRKDSTGQYLPVISINSTEVLGTPISQASFLTLVPTTDYFYMDVFLEESRATFRITTQGGVVVNEQYIDFGPLIGTFTVTHLPVFHRTYNSGATGTAVQLFVAQTSVWQIDSIAAPYQNLQAGMNYGSLTSPTVYSQNANYANSSAPGSATLANATAGYTTLGGQWQFAAVAGAETDYALFGFQVPAPYGFICTGVRISAWNNIVAVATTATVIEWGLGFNSSAVSLATAGASPPMKKKIGVHTFSIAAAVGASGGPDVQWQGIEVVQPGKFLHVIAKVILGTATATEIFRGTVSIDGYFE
jgi:hypothetical protein